MKKMAIVSSYNELCGNATYTEVLRKEFSKYYEVDVLALRTDILGSNKKIVSKMADKHVKEMAQKLKNYDYVNIQFEAGLYGTSRANILRRIKWLIDACNNLTFTMHRVDIPNSLFDKDFLKKLLKGKLFVNLKEYRQYNYMAKLYKIVAKYIKKGSKKRNLNIVVHTKREKKNIQQIFGFQRVYDFPITFMDEKMRSRVRNAKEREEFVKNYGMNNDDVLIGLFGFVSEYKGHDTAIRALKLLPSNYKILIFGSQHPMGILKNTAIDNYLDKLLKIIERNSAPASNSICLDMSSDHTDEGDKGPYWTSKSEDERFDKRVFFLGSLTDEEFIDALYCCDFAVLPYLETNQSGSGIASLVLESKIKSLYSNNKAFFELQKYYPQTFDTFDIGNYSELAYKILHYKHDYRDALDKCLEKYNLENNVLFQKSILEGTIVND